MKTDDTTSNCVGRRSTDDLRRDVDAALIKHVARFLDSHGGAVASAAISRDGDVTLEFKGACRACPAAAATFYSKVAPAVRAVPGVRSVMTPNVNVSEAAVKRILNISKLRPDSSLASK